jgi:hypothetical protein
MFGARAPYSAWTAAAFSSRNNGQSILKRSRGCLAFPLRISILYPTKVGIDRIQNLPLFFLGLATLFLGVCVGLFVQCRFLAAQIALAFFRNGRKSRRFSTA